MENSREEKSIARICEAFGEVIDQWTESLESDGGGRRYGSWVVERARELAGALSVVSPNPAGTGVAGPSERSDPTRSAG